MVKRVKVKAGENLSPANVKKAIKALEDGGTKKSACGILGIAYNTTRLQTIIENYNQELELDARMRAKKRGTRVLPDEAKSIIYSYLSNGSIEGTAKMHFRPVSIINEVLDEYGAKLRSPATDYFDPVLLPDKCIADSFEKGEYVWSSRYNTLAQIEKKISNAEYRIWVMGTNAQFSYQPLEELGSLKHLEELGIKFDNMEFYYES